MKRLEDWCYKHPAATITISICVGSIIGSILQIIFPLW